MSTENNEPADRKYSSTHKEKIAVHERDHQMCLSCQESFQTAEELDVHHIVPRGVAGPDTLKNKASLCRRCHEAVHGERDHCPTVRFMSTGDMVDKDFLWFKHLWKHQFPAVFEAATGRRIEPMFNHAESASYEAWHIPLGELRQVAKILTDMDVRYTSPMLAEYM
jgi:hypothetical protein